MRKGFIAGSFVLLVMSAVVTEASAETFVVTNSNAVANALLVFDTAGALIQSVPTNGQGGISGNAGGIATRNASVAVVNSGSQSVSVFERGEAGFELRQVVTTLSRPVSVAYGNDHLYILGELTIESHRIGGAGVEPDPDGAGALVRRDGSAAQVGVVGDQLVVTEKGGAIETIQLSDGAVGGDAVSLPLPADALNTPFGLVTRGSSAYITVAGSDQVVLVRNGQLLAQAATGVPNGSGQQAPCWAALVGPYLFTANSPSHSISRLVATGRSLTLDLPVAANTGGAPIDIAATDELLAVVESNSDGTSRVTQFHPDEDGNLVQTATSAIGTSANGVGVIFTR